LIEHGAPQDGGTSRPRGRGEYSPHSSPPAEGGGGHEHRSGGADQSVWLEAVHDVASTTRLHPYCLECGAVRSLQPMKGRPLGYFERALATLKADLDRDPRYPKLAQVHSHLIAAALASIPDFGDPFSMPFETQWAIFVAAVQRFRSDLDADLIHAALPVEPRRKRPAVIELLTKPGKEGEARVWLPH